MEFLLEMRSLNPTVTLIGDTGEKADVEAAKHAKTPFLGNRKNLQFGLTDEIYFRNPPVKS